MQVQVVWVDLCARYFNFPDPTFPASATQLRDWIAINSYARADYYEGFYRLRDELCERRSESAPSWPVWRCATHVFEQAQAHVGAGARERGEVRSGQGILFRTSGYPPRRRQDREPWMTTRAWYPS